MKKVIAIVLVISAIIVFFLVPIHYLSADLSDNVIVVDYESPPEKSSYSSSTRWEDENIGIENAETLKADFTQFYNPSFLPREHRHGAGIYVLWKVEEVGRSSPFVIFAGDGGGFVAGENVPSGYELMSFWSGELTWNPKGKKIESLGLTPPPGDYVLMARNWGESKMINFKVVPKESSE